MTLAKLNLLAPEPARDAFLSCCGSTSWVAAMLRSRPFPDLEALHSTAESLCAGLTESDWFEAFSRHPSIGTAAHPASPGAHWSAAEQRGMSNASSSIADAMRDFNVAYQAKFGFVFLICATGKSADEMLRSLETRLANSPAEELRIATAEQIKIMHLRLSKLAPRGHPQP